MGRGGLYWGSHTRAFYVKNGSVLLHYWRAKCRIPLLRCVLLVAKYIKVLLVSFRCSTRSKMCRILFW